MAGGGLIGKVICITRAYEEAQKMAELVKKRGGIPFMFPTIKQSFVEPNENDLSRLRSVKNYDVIIFTSANGVKFFLKALETAGVSVSEIQGKVACVGPQTGAYASSYGLICNLIPDEFVGNSLVDAITKSIPSGSKILYPRPRKVSKDLKNLLEPKGYEVDEIIVYETVADGANADEAAIKLKSGEIDALTFTSGSTVKYFVELLKERVELERALKDVIVAVIGPSTKKAAEKYGIKVDVMPEEYTVPAMLDALEKAFQG